MTVSKVVVLSSAWARAPHEERGFAVRSIAGALTRRCAVDVVVPGPSARLADGAFNVTAVGEPRQDRTWPTVDEIRRSGAPSPPWQELPDPAGTLAVVDTGDEEAHDLARALMGDVPIVAVGASGSARAGRTLLAVDVPAAPSHDGSGGASVCGASVHPVGLYARVHPGALNRRHYGLRSVPAYLLVLGDRSGAPLGPWPSAQVRWLLARFPRRYVVVVEGAAARVWRSRSCVTSFDVHTRMDLWLVTAHASGVVDLRPGPLFARECVEALRYGVPVIVPAGSSAHGLVTEGSALSFSDTAELLRCVEMLDDTPRRAAMAASGCAVTDRWYGSADALIERLAGVLATAGVA